MTSADKGMWNPEEPPRPDVPIPPSEQLPPYSHPDMKTSASEAKLKMAVEMEKGHSPYDFSAEIRQRRGECKNWWEFSLINVAAVVAFIVVLVAAGMGWKIFTDLSDELDNMNRSLSALSEQLRDQQTAFKHSGKAAVRAELRKTIAALDKAIGLDDKNITLQAVNLREEAVALLVSLEDEEKEQAAAPKDIPPAVAEPVVKAAPQQQPVPAEVKEEPKPVIGEPAPPPTPKVKKEETAPVESKQEPQAGQPSEAAPAPQEQSGMDTSPAAMTGDPAPPQGPGGEKETSGKEQPAIDPATPAPENPAPKAP